MSPLRPDFTEHSIALSRRGFIESCTILALSLGGCTSAGRRARLAHALVTDPPPGEYRPVLRHLIQAVLPFERSEFPLDPAAVEARLLDLYPIDDGDVYLAVQRGLALFDQVELFTVPAPLSEDEEDDLRFARGGDQSRSVAAMQRTDQRAFDEWTRRWGPGHDRFTGLSRDAQRGYLRMWVRSEFGVRRQFARSARTLVLVSAYSTEPVWDAIGYRGPLLERDHDAP